MTKSELIDIIAGNTGQTKVVVARVLDELALVVVDSLSQGAEVTVPGIGKLSTVRREARTGRNPQTGAPVAIAARMAVRFKALKTLKDGSN